LVPNYQFLAESMGMKVIYYDVVSVLALGNSKPCNSLHDLLCQADFVTLHVPKTDQTQNMMTEKQIMTMKKGSYLLNASRGTVVDISALAKCLRNGHIAGAAVDVYPTEPEANTKDWICELQNCPNTILTPHIGGSTEEAQYAIGLEVANKMIKLINTGNTSSSVNFPPVEAPIARPGTHRILNVHKNIPGVLKNINSLLAENNVVAQILSTHNNIGYLMLDCEKETSHTLKKDIAALTSSIKTRILY